MILKKVPENVLVLYHLGYVYGLPGKHMKEVFYYEKADTLGLDVERIFLIWALLRGVE